MSRQLGVQAHCLRHEMAVDFEGTLTRLASLGLHTIELCSFRGFAGNPWGDFGRLADWQPERVRTALEQAGIACMGAHFVEDEFHEDALGRLLDWALGVKSPIVVVPGIRMPEQPRLADWQAAADRLNEIGNRLREHGLRFAYHTQNSVWENLGGVLAFEALAERLEPELCQIELDPSGSLVYGTGWQELVREMPGRFVSMHLRDGEAPDRIVPYLPALPLGEGAVDWKSALAAASAAGVPYYLLEMEIERGGDVFGALETSLNYLPTVTPTG